MKTKKDFHIQLEEKEVRRFIESGIASASFVCDILKQIQKEEERKGLNKKMAEVEKNWKYKFLNPEFTRIVPKKESDKCHQCDGVIKAGVEYIKCPCGTAFCDLDCFEEYEKRIQINFFEDNDIGG